MKPRALILAATLTFGPTAFGAVEEMRLVACAVIKDDIRRLDCYDKIAMPLRMTEDADADSVPLQGTGRWASSQEKNPIDDTTTTTLATVSTSGTSRWGRPISLLIRCKSGKTDVYIGWDSYLGNEPIVLTRIGDRQATTARWNISTDKTLTFHPAPDGLLRQLLTEDRFLAQVTPYNESPITAIFDIRGLESNIKPLRPACGW